MVAAIAGSKIALFIWHKCRIFETGSDNFSASILAQLIRSYFGSSLVSKEKYPPPCL